VLCINSKVRTAGNIGKSSTTSPTSVIGVIAVVAFDGMAMCASDQRNI
jgi:hypothetical protein